MVAEASSEVSLTYRIRHTSLLTLVIPDLVFNGGNIGATFGNQQ